MALPTQTLHISTTAASDTAEPPGCTTAVPDRYGHVPPDACNANYGFYPSWEFNLVFALVFGLTALAHTVQAILFKKKFCWVVAMGALWESVCFVLRTLGAHDQQNSTYVVVSTLLFLLAPLWINAFAYMVVARLVHFLIPEQTVLNVPSRWLAKIFVTADVISFAIQAAGGAMLANQDSRDTVTTGQHVYMAGIATQLLFVFIFAAFALAFHRDLKRLRNNEHGRRANNTWVAPVVWTIFAVLILIVIRIVFRLIEFSQGVSSSNAILANEAYQLCLDALPMAIALVLLNIIHPGLVLKGPESSFPSRGWGRQLCRDKDKDRSQQSFLPLGGRSFEMNDRPEHSEP